ncbi:restriction endonuclease subunit S [Hydrogenophaga sp.]|uniref:restriction endonuclease subunit S n=1 Tax=Hydrogenophaga sp. TaxID=1904254 RepID=UPI002735CBC2|nr:restriction endonuclease subunit S [Hydrogenophaga sp.]MDP3886979.1 restriction endonuclease subunit S [Hydrogenophaga sp.]
MALTISVEDIISTTNNPLLQAKPHWTRFRLGDVATVLNGYAFKAELFNRTEGTPLIRIRDVGSDDSQTLYSGEFESKYLVQPGELLIGMDGDFNCARWRGKPSLLNQRVCKVSISTDAYEDRFLDFVLPGYLKAINDATSSITVKHLSSRTIQDIPLPCPPIVEQREIVAELEKQFSRLDEAVANLQRVKSNLKRYKASVLKAAVEGRLVETEATLARSEGRSYETGEQLLQRILETRRAKWAGRGKFKEAEGPKTHELPDVPEGWTWATLPQLGELNRGKSKHRPRDDKALYGGPYPFIQTGDVRRSDGSIADFSQTYSEAGLQQSRLWPTGTLCITIAANIAETGILQMDACFPDSVVGFIADQGPIMTEYVEVFIRTAKEKLDRFASATAQKNINLEVLQAVAVPTPPLAEQRRIVEELGRLLSILRGVDREVDTNLQRAQALRQSILSKAFSPCSSTEGVAA